MSGPITKLPLVIPPRKAAVPRPDIALEIGDLVLWDGKPHEHSSFKHGVIYKVVGKQEAGESNLNLARYHFRVVYEFNRPVGQEVASFEFSTTRDLKKLSLLDLGTLRLYLDNFIREWAKEEGAHVSEET